MRIAELDEYQFQDEMSKDPEMSQVSDTLNSMMLTNQSQHKSISQNNSSIHENQSKNMNKNSQIQQNLAQPKNIGNSQGQNLKPVSPKPEANFNTLFENSNPGIPEPRRAPNLKDRSNPSLNKIGNKPPTLNKGPQVSLNKLYGTHTSNSGESNKIFESNTSTNNSRQVSIGKSSGQPQLQQKPAPQGHNGSIMVSTNQPQLVQPQLQQKPNSSKEKTQEMNHTKNLLFSKDENLKNPQMANRGNRSRSISQTNSMMSNKNRSNVKMSFNSININSNINVNTGNDINKQPALTPLINPISQQRIGSSILPDDILQTKIEIKHPYENKPQQPLQQNPSQPMKNPQQSPGNQQPG